MGSVAASNHSNLVHRMLGDKVLTRCAETARKSRLEPALECSQTDSLFFQIKNFN